MEFAGCLPVAAAVAVAGLAAQNKAEDAGRKDLVAV